ncbi:MAG: Rossmann-like and DUF2520 domain-containing protein [Dehalococcoidia bacterium]
MNQGDGSRIGLVGAGRLGASLAAGLVKAGYRLTVVASERLESARALARTTGTGTTATGDPAEVAERADVVFLTVPDSRIADVCAAIPWATGHIAVHCSGALELDVLATASVRGAATGCLHPLQTFPSRTPEPERFNGVYCGIEGPEPAGSLLSRIASDLGALTFRLDGVDRAKYHAAAVMASNLVVALASAAGRLWTQAGLDPTAGRPALAPLTLAAAQNVSVMELARALTGPVARGDLTTIERHLTALEADASLSDIYRVLSRELLGLPLGHDPATAERLRELFG